MEENDTQDNRDQLYKNDRPVLRGIYARSGEGWRELIENLNTRNESAGIKIKSLKDIENPGRQAEAAFGMIPPAASGNSTWEEDIIAEQQNFGKPPKHLR